MSYQATSIVDTSNMLTDINRVLEGHLKSQFKQIVSEKREMEINIEYILEMPVIRKMKEELTKSKKENIELQIQIRVMENRLDRYEQHGKLHLEIKELSQTEEKPCTNIENRWKLMCKKTLERDNSYSVLNDLLSSDEEEDDDTSTNGSDHDSVQGTTNIKDIVIGDSAENQGAPTDTSDNEDEESGKELFEMIINNQTYYTDDNWTGTLFEYLDGTPGKKIGHLMDGKPFFS
jgi:hypothetical protein